MLLQEEISELEEGVREMREEYLVKNVAKRKVTFIIPKVVYNLAGGGELELVYALLALS